MYNKSIKVIESEATPKLQAGIKTRQNYGNFSIVFCHHQNTSKEAPDIKSASVEFPRLFGLLAKRLMKVFFINTKNDKRF